MKPNRPRVLNLRPQRLWFGLGLAALLGASLIFAYISQARGRPVYYLPPQGETLLYLAATSGGVNDVLLANTDLAANGMTVVYTGAELQQRYATAPTDAIIVHGTRLAEVDGAWLQARYRQGTVIGALNVTLHTLALLVGDQAVANDPTWADGWQKEPFFSLLAMRASNEIEPVSGQAVQGASTASTDNIREPSDIDVFLSLVRRDIRAGQDFATKHLTTPEVPK